MRGTPTRYRDTLPICRFIPAHAGNTRHAPRHPPPHTVHPRACGEHPHISISISDCDGSSPRMRGTHTEELFRLFRKRFIPAHAGNTRFADLQRLHPPVHPRACGEHNACSQPSLIRPGSSPRMRGTRHHAILSMIDMRFIPAHAGNTSAVPYTRSLSSVHPRACGEHFEQIELTATIIGSSPRMRGTRARNPSSRLPNGFIPAHAGNTSSTLHMICGDSVHPRACGEHDNIYLSCADVGGSSPRMRGTPKITAHGARSGRFIPAHAGNTSRGQ